MDETPLQIAGTLFWLLLVAGTIFGVRRYAKTRKTTMSFWQFSFGQLFALLTIGTLLSWMLYVWCLDFFYEVRP